MDKCIWCEKEINPENKLVITIFLSDMHVTCETTEHILYHRECFDELKSSLLSIARREYLGSQAREDKLKSLFRTRDE